MWLSCKRDEKGTWIEEILQEKANKEAMTLVKENIPPRAVAGKETQQPDG